MEFQCRLGTPQGEVVEGIYVAESESRLRHELEEKGLFVLDIRARGGARRLRRTGHRRPAGRQRKVSSREFLVFNQELATLLKAGLPLVQSLDILRRAIPNPTFKAVLDDVYERVRAGTSLSEAFEAHATLFPGVYTASLMAGEKSGNLDQVLRRFIAYVKIIGNVKRKTMSALMYPVILFILSIVVVAVIMVKVVPAFADFYGDFGAELPFITRDPDRDLRRGPQSPAADHARARSAAAWRSGGGSRCRASACACTRLLMRAPVIGGDA